MSNTLSKHLLCNVLEILVPLWVAGIIAGVVVFLIFICLICVCKKCCCKKKEKEEEEEQKDVVDLKSVQLVAASYHEKVQPSMDELDYNSEGFGSQCGSDVAIGRLNQFRYNSHFKYSYTDYVYVWLMGTILHTLANCLLNGQDNQ